MKIAFIYDWLNTRKGGGEAMMLELAAMYPEAPIYTMLFDAETYQGELDPARVKTSFLQKLPAWLRKRTRYLLPLIPLAIESYDLGEYDVVISVSSGYSKSVITRPETLHICYCYSPTRFLWDYWPRYVKDQHVGAMRRGSIHVLTSRLRLWDFYSAKRVDKWVAISQTVAKRITKYYRQPIERIIYPGVHLNKFKPVSPAQKENYFVTLSSLTPYKRIDLAIQACVQLGKRLVIIGDGPDRGRLESLAGDTVRFVGRVNDSQRADLLARATALLFPGEEDFGITPLDAMASGTPVIAYGKGGVTETVISGKTGIFFAEPTVQSLVNAISSFEADRFKTNDLTQQAAKFDIQLFRKQFKDYVEETYKNHVNTK